MKTTFSEEGDIRSVDVLAALVGLWREGASGALHFSRSGATAGFQLSAGELTGVTSSDARFETAAILMRAGKLEAANIDRLVTPQGGDRALGALHAGILTKREWRWGEKIRAVEVLSELLTWIEGDYVFDRGAHAEAGEFRLTVPRLILELFLRSRDRGLILHYLGGADVPLARGPHFEAEFAAFGLTADAEAVVRLIDGKATAAHISSEGPAEPFAVEKLLAALVTLGLVYPEFVAPEGALKGAPEGAPRSAAPEGAQIAAHEGPLTVVPEDVAEGARDEHAESLDEDEDVREEEIEGREEEEQEEEEPGSPAPYSELDVRSPTAPEETGTEFEAEQDELGGAEAPEDESAESAIGDYEIRDAAAASEPAGPASSGEPGDAGAALEYDSPEESTDDAAGEGRALPGPTSLETLEPLETTAPESKGRFPLDYATGVGSAERPGPLSGARWLWLLVLLAAGVGAVILLRGRGAAPTTRIAATRESPTPFPTEGPMALSAVTSPAPTEAAPVTPNGAPVAAPTSARPGVAAPTSARPQIAATTIVAPRAPTSAPKAPTAAPRPTTRPAATPRPVASPRAAPAQAAPAPSSEPPGATRQSWLDRAARDRQKASADRRNHFTIQLELACETQTLVDAWKHDRPAGTMWVLTSPYEGKTCFRVLWGRYPSKDAARRALAGVPSFFSSNHNRPVVTAIP
ncbi:MAG TPA: hypothetical protein VGK26_07465 [Thermoanaerobaculia bacterium]